MDFQRYGIDPRLAQAAEGKKISFFLYEKMLSHAVQKQENVCAKISLAEGREEVLILPALQWLLSGAERKVLVTVPDRASAERYSLAIASLGAGAGIETCLVDRAALSEGGPASPVFEGDPSSAVVIGQLDELLFAAPPLNLREYGFLVVDGADRMADMAADTIRKFVAALLPSHERRALLACAKITTKAKNLARDLADNPSEISIEGEVAKAQSVAKETWIVAGEAKLKFLLGLLKREKPERVCVFCNLKDTSEDLSRRLEANGIETDFILGPLPPEKKSVILEKIKSVEGSCLVLTDPGAEGLEVGAFPLVVNYDIPLEPEFFVKRLEMLDRSFPAAKVVSLACDRYMYGLPAVESYIDAKLDATPAAPSMLDEVDKSEGMDFKARPRRDAYPREDAGRGQQRGGRRTGGDRDSRRRDGQSGQGGQRESNRYRDASRDAYPGGGRSPDIRKSISDATGGSLDMGGQAPASRLPAKDGARQQRQAPRAPEGQDRRGQQGRSQGQREGGKRGPKGRQGPGRQDSGQQPQRTPNRAAASRQGPLNGVPSRPGAPNSGPTKTGNPYDMPIEERMKRYREKYGRGLDEGAKGGPRGESPRGAGGNGSRPIEGPSRQSKGKRPRTDEVGHSREPVGKAAEPSAQKPEGLFGKFLSAFKKKDE